VTTTTSPCSAAFSANDNPAIPLPITKKSHRTSFASALTIDWSLAFAISFRLQHSTIPGKNQAIFVAAKTLDALYRSAADAGEHRSGEKAMKKTGPNRWGKVAVDAEKGKSSVGG
jgi:hypothetical protein